MAVDVLRELLYRFEREGVIPSSAAVERFDPSSGAVVDVGFGRYDAERHAEGAVLKAVTLHEAAIERDGSAFRGRIVFDV
jgi:SHS2 domain-containing protein